MSRPVLEAPVKYGRVYPDPRAEEMLTDLARRMSDSVGPYLDGLSDDALYLLRVGIGQLSTTNCWWLIYELRGAIEGLISEVEARKADSDV